MLDRFLRQERTPVFTVISLLLTLLVWLLILLLGYQENGLVGTPVTVILLVGGVPLNGLVGIIASMRDEHRGLEVAVAGVGLWFVTVGALAGSGRYW
jgi:hypothetical protein